MNSRHLVFGLSLVALAACTARPSDSVVGDRPIWGDSLVLQEEMRIGGLFGDEPYTFGYVSTLAPAPDGSLYVGDSQVPIIRRYDSDGVYLGDVGRGGQGPGEYRGFDGLAVLSDGRLTVWDSGNARMSFFDPTGEFQESFPVRNGIGGWRGFAYSPNGDLFVRTRPLDGLVETPEGLLRIKWAKVRPGGTTEALATVPPEDRVGPRYVLSGRGGYYRAFVVMTVNAMAPDGSMYWARNDEYVIHRLLPRGEELLITRSEDPIRVSPQETTEWEARSEYFAQRNPQQREDYFPIPEVKPFLRELVVDPEGRLWVSRYTEAVHRPYSPEERAEREEQGLVDFTWRDTTTWDVFDSLGNLLGVVTLPLQTSFVTAIGDQVWGVEQGDYREDYVIRWRIVEAGG